VTLDYQGKWCWWSELVSLFKHQSFSLDSIQQAVFASTRSSEKPAVTLYDIDGMWGKYEHHVLAKAKELGIKFIPFQNGIIVSIE